MATLLLHLADFDEASWAARFAAALPGHRVVRRGDDYAPADIDYIFTWKPVPDAFEGLSNLKAVLSLGAGVDALLQHPRLPANVPIVRFIDARSLWQKILDHRHVMTESGNFAARRREQQVKWMWSMLEQRIMARLRSDASVRGKVKKIEAEVADGRITPSLAAEQIAEMLR